MKGDITVFISQPVTRLAQLNLILEQVLKYTPEGRSPYLLQYVLKMGDFLTMLTQITLTMRRYL